MVTHEIFERYAWSVACLLMIFITAIAVFYQKKFGVTTYYQLYLIPIIMLLFTAIDLMSSYNRLISESIEVAGTGLSFVVSLFLYQKMVGVKK